MRTKNQESIRAIESFINRFIDENGVSPTMMEIAENTGISKSNVSRYVAYMRENHILDFDHTHRSIVTRTAKMARQPMLRVPVLGAVSCGVPKLAEENIEDYVQLPASLFGTGEFYLLRANGESMIEAGIGDRDLVLIHRQPTADEGQIVVALIDEDEATLKRFYPEGDRVRLHPENSAMEDILVENCIIQGVAVMVFKDLQ